MATQLFAAGAEDVLYVIDLSSYMLRAYHAIAPLSNAAGEPTHAVYGTVTMLERLVRERQPRFLVVAMDSGRITFRKEIYDAYKANRPPAPADLKTQMARCEEIVRAFSIPILKQDGVEADDLIACAVKRAHARDIKVVIVAADKDLMQLVTDDVILWDTMRDRVFGPSEVEERFGVKVSQLRDLLALMGDSSDNIPGVPHIGPKTARDLLVEFGSLEGIYEHLDAIKKKACRDTLTQHKDEAFLSQRLVTLREDCPIEFDLEALRYGGRDVDRLRELYSVLEFHRQLKALDSEGAAPEVGRVGAPSEASGGAVLAAQKPPPPSAPSEISHTSVLDRAALTRLAEELRSAGRFALLATTTSLRPNAVLAGLAFASGAGRAFYVPIEHRYVGAPAQVTLADVSEILGPLLCDPALGKLAHDAKRAAVRLADAGLPLSGVVFDSEIANYLLNPESNHTLEALAEDELGVKLVTYDSLTKKARGQQTDFENVPLEEALPYAASQADICFRLWQRLAPRIQDEALGRLLDEVELPLSEILVHMERLGVLVNIAALSELGKVCQATLDRLEHEAHRIAGRVFNVNSPRQLETLLFDECGLKPLKRTKTSRSTDASTLEALAEQHELPKVILEHRQVAKLKGTYIDALPSLMNPKTGRIHTRWEQAVAATGRISSTDPNLQNIPIRTELGRLIRGTFIARPGYQLVSADYSQIELRVLAHLSQDPVLLDAFRTGQDIHTRTAMEIFEVMADGVTREMRTKTKAVNFGVIYGQGDSGLAKSLGIPRQEAANFIAAYFRRYEGVRRFMQGTLESARDSETVRSLLGRRRLVPDIKSGNRARRLAAERIAMNMPIQSSAADLLKLAMLKLREPVSPGAEMILTVHDELVFEVPDAEVELAKPRIKQAMENVYPLDVPLLVEIGQGPNWNAAH
ncbi:MAG TPA: DNA polymerase I [Polyangiaceae bacterium]|nr:DNA polymerase I [Polyangiaceae bacterium]